MTYINHTYNLLKEEIRLLTLCPAVNPQKDHGFTGVDDGIRCTTQRYTFGDCPPYTALSYRWGSASLRVDITVNGHEAKVTRNLEAALRYLRRNSEPIILWIDDLCIDQHNDREKSEQVAQMREIYQKAIEVVSWLGPAANDSDVAMRFIETFGQRSWELGIGSKPELQLMRLLKDIDGQTDPQLRDFLQDLTAELSPASPRYAKLGSALSALFKRSYWGRIWVVQEVAVGASVTFVCGERSASEESLHHASRLFRNFGFHQQDGQRVNRDSHDHPSSGQTTLAIDPSRPINLLKVRRAPGPLPLIYLLRSLRQFQASDPRDKVFALLGIASDRRELGINVNYHKSCEEVYAETAYTLINHGWTEVLSLNGSVKQHESLPSWAPDWSRHSYPSRLQQRTLTRATWPLKSVLQPKFAVSKLVESGLSSYGGPVKMENHMLFLDANFVDTVEHLGRPWAKAGIGSWLHELQSLSKLTPTVAERSHVWRCAVADQEIRQATDKPRMTPALLNKVDEALANRDLINIDSQLLTEIGLEKYATQLQAVAPGRRPFLTSKGHIGIGPKDMQKHDLVVVVPGSEVPYLIRGLLAKKMFHLIGEIYVHGIMDGESLSAESKLETIALA